MQTLEIELINEKANRLELVRLALGVSKSKLAELVGSEQSHISKVISGKANLGKHLSDQIVRSLNLNASWWETGEGEMFLQEKTEDETTHSPYNGIDRGSSTTANMWVVPAKAQGGFILGFRNRMFKHMLDRVPFPQINGECFSFEIEGFSMYPAYNPGSTIVCTFIPDRSWLRKGKAYVFQTNDGLVIKNFDRVEDGKIYLESENPAYNPVDPILTDDLVQLYEIEYVISKPPNKGV